MCDHKGYDHVPFINTPGLGWGEINNLDQTLFTCTASNNAAAP